jgi:hypothetical protein
MERIDLVLSPLDSKLMSAVNRFFGFGCVVVEWRQWRVPVLDAKMKQ